MFDPLRGIARSGHNARLTLIVVVAVVLDVNFDVSEHHTI